jgi:hypothetical protein
MSIPPILAWTCHEDGQIGMLTAPSNELSFKQSEQVLHSVPYSQWSARLVPHATGVLAIFVAYDTREWQLWRSCHDGISGRLSDSSYNYCTSMCFGNYYSVIEQNNGGTYQAVILNLRNKNKRIVNLGNVVPAREGIFPFILAEDADGFLLSIFSNSDDSTIVYAYKSRGTQ